METKVLVYETFFSENAHLMGYLFLDTIRGTEHPSFAFDPAWLEQNAGKTYRIDPELSYTTGRQYPTGKAIFGIFADSCPDRWGRVLMERRERLRADQEGRKPRKLNEGDYLLGVYDETRMGAIRLKAEEDGPFLSDDAETTVPPWTTVRNLEEAARNFENEETTLQEKWLNQLLKPGSSLGGARPKATVRDPEGNLWIAKFPSRKDDYDVGAWEKTAHDLAVLCGLHTTETRLQTFSKFGSTFFIKRFDRAGDRRIHFASAMTLLGRSDGESGECSYLDLVSLIKSDGTRPKEDLRELWKRMVFNMAITNTDDHLRNHGFLLTSGGWTLSPLYDVNPVPYGDTLSLCIDGENNRISLSAALQTAKYYGLSSAEAKEIADGILTTVRDHWRSCAEANRITRSSIENMRPAFDLCTTL